VLPKEREKRALKIVLTVIIIGLLCFSTFSVLAPHVKATETGGPKYYNQNPESEVDSSFYTISYTVDCFSKDWMSSKTDASGVTKYGVTFFSNTKSLDYTTVSFFIEGQDASGMTKWIPSPTSRMTVALYVTYMVSSWDNIDPLNLPKFKIVDGETLQTLASEDITPTVSQWFTTMIYATIEKGRSFKALWGFDWVNIPPLKPTIYIDSWRVVTFDSDEILNLDPGDEYRRNKFGPDTGGFYGGRSGTLSGEAVSISIYNIMGTGVPGLSLWYAGTNTLVTRMPMTLSKAQNGYYTNHQPGPGESSWGTWSWTAVTAWGSGYHLIFVSKDLIYTAGYVEQFGPYPMFPFPGVDYWHFAWSFGFIERVDTESVVASWIDKFSSSNWGMLPDSGSLSFESGGVPMSEITTPSLGIYRKEISITNFGVSGSRFYLNFWGPGAGFSGWLPVSGAPSQLTIQKITPNSSPSATVVFYLNDLVMFLVKLVDQNGIPVVGASVSGTLTPPNPLAPLPLTFIDGNDGTYAAFYQIPQSSDAVGDYSISISALKPGTLTATASDYFTVDGSRTMSEYWMGRVKQGEFIESYVNVRSPTTTGSRTLSFYLSSQTNDILYCYLESPSGISYSMTYNQNIQTISIEDPESGNWRVKVYGQTITQDGTFIIGYLDEYRDGSIFLFDGVFKQIETFVLKQIIQKTVAYILGLSRNVGLVFGVSLSLLTTYTAGGFNPVVVTSRTTDGKENVGGVVLDGKAYDFSVDQDAAAATRLGGIYATAIAPLGYTFSRWEKADPSFIVSFSDSEEASTIIYADPEGASVVAVFEPVSSSLRVSVKSPIDILVEAPNGLRIGYDPVTESIINEIPGATYSGNGTEPQVIIIPNPIIGIYEISGHATGLGTYTIEALSTLETSLVDIEKWTGETIVGEYYQKTMLLNENGALGDENPPVTTLTIGEPKNIIGTQVYVTKDSSFALQASDGIGFGVASTAYRIYNATYDSRWITYTQPFCIIGLSDGTYSIDYNSTDNAGNIEPTNTKTLILDNTAPQITVLNPPAEWALQDGVTFVVSAIDASGVSSLTFSIREANNGEGVPIGFENLPATYNSITEEWTFPIDTLQFPDGYYVVLLEAEDNLGHTGSIMIPYSIRNWALIELLPASETNKAGRTMPVKFALRVAASVDPNQPFVYNENLTIKIYAKDDPSNILQTSTFGDTARDYRINPVNELYITNFQTLKTPKTYVVEIYRQTMLIDTFEFSTV